MASTTTNTATDLPSLTESISLFLEDSLWNLVKTAVPVCSQCNGTLPNTPQSTHLRSTLGHQDNQSGLAGLIAHLPSGSQHLPPQSVVHQQKASLSEGAWGHPCVIMPTSLALCDHLVYCVPVTSFGGKGLSSKLETVSLKKACFLKRNYLPISHPGQQLSKGPAALPEVLDINIPMEKPSSVALERAYWIESQYLSLYFKRGESSPRRLPRQSVETLTRKYMDAEKLRQRTAGSWRQGVIATSSPTRPPLGPLLNLEVRSNKRTRSWTDSDDTSRRMPPAKAPKRDLGACWRKQAAENISPTKFRP